MSGNPKLLEKMIAHALSGKGSHVAAKTIFDGLGWKVAGARPAGIPHSLFQLLNHLKFWQDWVVQWMDGGMPPVPKHAPGGWPGGDSPASRREWDRAVRAFRKGLERLERQSRQGDLVAKRGKSSRLEMLQAIASHNSYHLGQAVQLRQMLGAWPPRSGGLTW